MDTTKNQSEINVGVDTGKDQLDIYVRPLNKFYSVKNNDEGISEVITMLKGIKPTRVVIEATGRLEYQFVLACSKAKIPFSIINPVRIKRFAGVIGRLAKTDKLDAKLIAQFSESMKPEPSSLKPETLRLMSDLVSRRGQLLAMQTMEKNRLQIMPKEIQPIIKPILTALKKQIEKVEKKMLALIEGCKEYKAKSDILQSMPGIGKVVAVSLISNFPELGYITNKQASALLGVAPINRESGRYQGVSRIRGGRPQVRTVMFMAMMSAMQCNPVFKEKYQQLVKQGKPKKVAIIACVRKMIVILNAMVRDEKKWSPAVA